MDETKRQDLPTGLWVVATPIGNLGDLSVRARAALATADAVLCEDTRRTSQLMAALGLRTRLERFDAHTDRGRVRFLLERLSAGESFALVTDAGTPAISDPGAVLVAAAHEAGVRVTPVPGPSAVMTLLSAAGIQETAFTFRGFFPRKDKERSEEIKGAIGSPLSRMFVWFESPNRIEGTLAQVAELSPDAQVTASKELTKAHERFFQGRATEVLEKVREELAREGELGEWSFAVRFPDEEKQEVSGAWMSALQCLLDAGISPSDAAKRVCHYFDVSRKEAYEQALRLSGRK